jgi:hypothetical protein
VGTPVPGRYRRVTKTNGFAARARSAGSRTGAGERRDSSSTRGAVRSVGHDPVALPEISAAAPTSTALVPFLEPLGIQPWAGVDVHVPGLPCA